MNKNKQSPVDDHHAEMQKKNARLGLIVLAAVLIMVGVSFAAVPLYNLFCRVTGFGGTTQVADQLPENIVDRRVTIKFDSVTADNLPWNFKPAVKSVDINIGARGLTSFEASNKADKPTAGTALYNVTPLKVGKYFNKVQCFCFDEQILAPGERVDMPVMFYLDPEMADDPNMDDVSVITLSYSFYKAESEALDQALEAFYNGEESGI